MGLVFYPFFKTLTNGKKVEFCFESKFSENVIEKVLKISLL